MITTLNSGQIHHESMYSYSCLEGVQLSIHNPKKKLEERANDWAFILMVSVLKIKVKISIQRKKIKPLFHPFLKHESKLFWHELEGNSGPQVLFFGGPSHRHSLKENQWPNPSISSSSGWNRPRLYVLKQPATNSAYFYIEYWTWVSLIKLSRGL